MRKLEVYAYPRVSAGDGEKRMESRESLVKCEKRRGFAGMAMLRMCGCDAVV